jgi:hypothetical protein
MRAVLAIALLLSGACTVEVDDTGPCIANTSGEPIMLIDPVTLECVAFAPDACDPRCGPCAADAVQLPTWGRCGSACRNLDEQSCAAAPACRVARDFNLYYQRGGASGDATFAGCWPLDQVPQSGKACYGLDAFACSQNAECTALYDGPENARVYAACVSEKEQLGKCTGPVQCNAIPPPCPSDSLPGIENGCYTGSCLPREFCDIVDIEPTPV